MIWRILAVLFGISWIVSGVAARNPLVIVLGVAVVFLGVRSMVERARRIREYRSRDVLYPGGSDPGGPYRPYGSVPRGRSSTSGFPGDENNDTDVLARSIAAVLKHVALQEGVGSAGWNQAREFLIGASQGTMPFPAAEAFLREAQLSHIRRHRLSENVKIFLVRGALEIAVADHVLTAAEEAAVVEVIQALWGDTRELAQLKLDAFLKVLLSEGDTEKDDALRTLGLGSDATTSQIRDAYLSLVRKHHPDRAAPADKASATTRTAQINAAYDYLMGVK